MTGIEFVSRLREIPTYPAAATYGYEGELVKLASNETPWGPHPAVVEAVQASLANANRYPDPTAAMLRRRLAERCDLPPERIAVGNGSCEILLAAAQAMLEPGAEIVYAWPSFSMYPQLAAMTGARAVEVPLDAAGRHDLDAMAREVTVATRIVIVCNPNNPTATALGADALTAFVEALPRHVLVVLDEAYVEFSLAQQPDQSLELIRRHPNVVVLRTFSKVYGLCGLRAGYSLGSADFKRAVDLVRQPFSVNAVAQAAAAEALLHQDEVARRVERTVVERVHVESALAARGLETTASQANFAWLSVGAVEEDEADAAIRAREEEVMRGLGERGVIVRSGTDLGAPGHLRVTFGTRAENDRFLEALDEVLGG